MAHISSPISTLASVHLFHLDASSWSRVPDRQAITLSSVQSLQLLDDLVAATERYCIYIHVGKSELDVDIL